MPVVRKRPWTVKAAAVFGDDWIPFETAVGRIAAFIPPGIAWRQAERMRRRSQRRRGRPETARVLGDDGQAIACGARRLAVEWIRKQTVRGFLDRTAVDSVDCLRLASAQSEAS